MHSHQRERAVAHASRCAMQWEAIGARRDSVFLDISVYKVRNVQMACISAPHLSYLECKRSLARRCDATCWCTRARTRIRTNYARSFGHIQRHVRFEALLSQYTRREFSPRSIQLKFNPNSWIQGTRIFFFSITYQTAFENVENCL